MSTLSARVARDRLCIAGVGLFIAACGQVGTSSGNQGTSGDAGGDPFTNPSSWNAFDVSSLGQGGGGWGAVFAAGALYVVPYFGVAARYDTRAPIDAASSWSTFAVTTLGAKVNQMAGGVTDGRYVYFAPLVASLDTGVVPRYDTTLPFTAARSWSTFDLTTVNAAAVGFQGAVFDGHHAYFMPNAHATIARYDTSGPFDGHGSWETFDVTRVSPRAGGFTGGVFDGRYIYLVPGPSGVVARYDTMAPLVSDSSWSTFDLGRVTAGGFLGGVFDGRYVYFVPYSGDHVPFVVARYDTSAPFDASSSWETADVSAFDSSYDYPGGRGFAGGAFDGRFVYFAPRGSPFAARYDTTASFGTRSSWAFFDVASVNRMAGGFYGMGFDGEFVYFIPNGSEVVTRFRASSHDSIPSAMHGGSFL